MKNLSVKDIAELLAQNEETIRRKIRDGKIQAMKSYNRQGYEIPPQQFIQDGLITERKLEEYLGQKEQGKQEEDIDSWLDIVKEYEARGETGQLETVLRLTQAMDQIYDKRMEKSLYSASLMQKYKKAEEEIRFLDSQIEQIKLYIELIKKK